MDISRAACRKDARLVTAIVIGLACDYVCVLLPDPVRGALVVRAHRNLAAGHLVLASDQGRAGLEEGARVAGDERAAWNAAGFWGVANGRCRIWASEPQARAREARAKRITAISEAVAVDKRRASLQLVKGWALEG